MTGANSAAAPRRTWHYWLILLIGIAAAASFPPVRDWWQSIDVAISRAFNGMLGKNQRLDDAIAALASDPGDAAAFVLYACFLFAHTLLGRDREERFRRAAFWFWAGVAFSIFFFLNREISPIVKRQSPSRVIEGWTDLHKIYGEHLITRRKNTFPSDHASAWFFFAFMGMRKYRRIGPVLLTLAIILPLARVFSGAHWMGDIVLGSIPLMLFGAAVTTETPLATGYHACHGLLRGAWLLVFDRGKGRISERVPMAWREFANTILRAFPT